MQHRLPQQHPAPAPSVPRSAGGQRRQRTGIGSIETGHHPPGRVVEDSSLQVLDRLQGCLLYTSDAADE
ncbi:MAG: hypothetical protein QUU85_16030, partial [Candidatus Eisenbacteria bacterium]|nr:hypothetical protein [Candidatus Eisenbacteria bacterium]